MHKQFYDLQSHLDEKSLPPYPSYLIPELRSTHIDNELSEIYKLIIPEISSNEKLLPLLHSYTNLPLEANINEIERLLKDQVPVKGSFFDLSGSSEVQDGFKTASNKSIEKIPLNNKENKTTQEDNYLIERIKNEILENVQNVTWDDIVGLDNVKRIINEIVLWPMLRPDLFKGLRGPPKGLMLFGPPGTGKTMIGKCIASQCNATFFSISASSLTSKWVGEGEKMVRVLFELSRQMQPSVIFIDEIDSLLSQRTENENEGSRRIKTEFLVQFDGTSSNNDDKILIIGATNRPQEIDEAARRRLVKRIYVGLPDNKSRSNLVRKLVKDFRNNLSDADYNTIAEMTEGYSGSDMFNLCREASLEPLREIDNIKDFDVNNTREINLQDFIKATNQIKKSVSEKDLNLYKEWNVIYGSF